MVRSWAAATLAAALLTSACTVEAPSAGQVDEPYYSSAAALDAAASTVIRGVVTSVSDADTGGSALAEVAVLATAKGEPDPSVRVEFIPEGAGTPISSPLEAGQEYVLLLSPVGDHDGSVNSTQGWYLVEDGVAKAGPENRVPLPDDWTEALDVTSH